MMRLVKFEAPMRGVFLLMLMVMVAANSALAQYTVSGRVLAPDNTGLASASIQVLNSNLATATDEQGNFALAQVADGKHVTRVSAVGCATEDYTAIVEGNLTVDIQLNGVENRQDEAVVTAHKMESDPHDIPASLSVVNSKA